MTDQTFELPKGGVPTEQQCAQGSRTSKSPELYALIAPSVVLSTHQQQIEDTWKTVEHTETRGLASVCRKVVEDE